MFCAINRLNTQNFFVMHITFLGLVDLGFLAAGSTLAEATDFPFGKNDSLSDVKVPLSSASELSLSE